MNIQFGLWNFETGPVTPIQISRVRSILDRLPFEGHEEFRDSEIYFLRRYAGANKEIRQPFRSEAGCILCWDGRLHNRLDLADALGSTRLRTACDVEVVAAAYDRWGTGMFSKLIGDWALSLWNPNERAVILAKDFLGTRPLYYSAKAGSLRWGSLIDPLILAGVSSPFLDEEYVAGWFARFPATHLSPYLGVKAVPPSCFVLFQDGRQIVQRHWEFDPAKRIVYKNRADYEQHFGEVFAKSVTRRLRSAAPVLAELSGGMDSSSIVCMADRIISEGRAEAPRLDTISYYDDMEPNWDESAYFRVVERQRGRTGLHLPVDFRNNLHPAFPSERFAATPGSGTGHNGNEAYLAHVRSGGYRVLLQGLGGDEVLGGVPAPSPELADLLASARFVSFAKSILAWALEMKVPLVHLAMEALRELLPLPHAQDERSSLPWLLPEFVRRNRKALGGYERSTASFFAGRPSFRANLAALEDLRRHISCLATANATETLERRYPYLDRDLLEFLYAIPREELIRPHERRSLMRRSLRGLVPEEILNRKRKAFIARAPVAALRTEMDCILRETNHMLTSDMGIVDKNKFRQSLKRAADGQATPVVPLLRTLLVEAWLRHISTWTDRRELSFLSSETAESSLYTSHSIHSSLS
jgi:asparagine synthase (glutamine-hydrolysing)